MANNTALSITGMGLVSGAGIGVTETLQLFSDSFIDTETKLGTDLPIVGVTARTEWAADFKEDQLKVNLFALTAAREAIATAGLTSQDFSNLRIGVCIGSTVGCSNFQSSFSVPYNRGDLPHPAPILNHFRNNTAQFISRTLGCNGPALLVSNACTSGADAIGIGANWIRSGVCDVVICGGAEEIIPQIYYGFKSMMLCSPLMCTPFDKNRQGLTLGEGAGILVLEKNKTPRRSMARLLGYGSTSDAYHPTAPHPEGRWLNVAVQTALKQAGLSRADFINAHGTATEHNDHSEGTWMRLHAENWPVVATKGYTGHTLAAAGAIEAVLTILSLQKQKLPRSKGFREVDPKIGVRPTTQIVSGNFDSALSFSIGFGGTNAVMCFGRES